MDWIKMRTTLRDDPAVVSIAVNLRLDRDHVVGLLHRLWSFASMQTANGKLQGITSDWLDLYMERPGFVESLVKVGWIAVTKQGLRIPRFDRHLSKGSKSRALTAMRVAKHRALRSNTTSVTKSLPEKRREEKKNTPPKPPPAGGAEVSLRRSGKKGKSFDQASMEAGL